MEILKFIGNEISYFFKSWLDISIQKIQQILNTGKTGL